MRIRHFASGILVLTALAASATAEPQSFIPWTMPEVSALPRDARGQLIRDGRDLMLATYAFIGPNVDDAAKRFAGNNLACTNCHMKAGLQPLAAPFVSWPTDEGLCPSRSPGYLHKDIA